MAFMHPQAEAFGPQEAKEYADIDHDKMAWYSRLSAPGYLDCTDWSGPFKTEKEALQYIMDFYNVDADGNDTEFDDVTPTEGLK